MRLRSILFASLAALACAFIYQLPAAASYDQPSYVLRADIQRSIDEFTMVADKMEIQREAAAVFKNNDLISARGAGMILGGTGGSKHPFDLKPEYAESVATDGLNFIDLRRRC